MMVSVSWTSSEDDALVYGCVGEFFSRAIEAANEVHLLHPWIYLNYASPDQDVFRGYNQDGYKRLQAIAREADPKGVFAKNGLCSGLFKVSDHGIWGGKQRLVDQAKQEWKNYEL